MDPSYLPSNQPYQFFDLSLDVDGSNTTRAVPYGIDISLLQRSVAAAHPACEQKADPCLSLDDLELYSLNYSSPTTTLCTPSMDFYASEFIAVPGTRSMSLSRMISEEKKEPTAAQSRRRAQNRAAQRAFRDRKERRIKDLEAKIKQLEEKSTSVDGENARLKKEIVRLTNINHMLRISSYKDDLDSYM